MNLSPFTEAGLVGVCFALILLCYYIIKEWRKGSDRVADAMLKIATVLESLKTIIEQK